MFLGNTYLPGTEGTLIYRVEWEQQSYEKVAEETVGRVHPGTSTTSVTRPLLPRLLTPPRGYESHLSRSRPAGAPGWPLTHHAPGESQHFLVLYGKVRPPEAQRTRPAPGQPSGHCSQREKGAETF